jgi:hypothetical protein
VGDAEVRAGAPHGRAQRAEVGRADAVVDVEAVRVGVQRDDLGAGRGVASGAHVDAAPCAQSTTTAARPAAAGCAQQVRDVAAGVREVAHAADPRPGGTGERRAEPCLDGELDGVGQLVARPLRRA